MYHYQDPHQHCYSYNKKGNGSRLISSLTDERTEKPTRCLQYWTHCCVMAPNEISTEEQEEERGGKHEGGGRQRKGIEWVCVDMGGHSATETGSSRNNSVPPQKGTSVLCSPLDSISRMHMSTTMGLMVLWAWISVVRSQLYTFLTCFRSGLQSLGTTGEHCLWTFMPQSAETERGERQHKSLSNSIKRAKSNGRNCTVDKNKDRYRTSFLFKRELK